MSLENLTEFEQRQLNLGKLVGTMLQDPKLSSKTKRLLKERDPTLQFPELDQEEAIESVRREAKKENELLRADIAKREAREALVAEEHRILDAGFDPKAIREFMTKEGLTNLELVLEHFTMKQQLAEPSSDQVGPFRFADATPEDLSKMWKDPVGWRENKAYEVLKESRGTARGRAA